MIMNNPPIILPPYIIWENPNSHPMMELVHLWCRILWMIYIKNNEGILIMFDGELIDKNKYQASGFCLFGFESKSRTSMNRTTSKHFGNNLRLILIFIFPVLCGVVQIDGETVLIVQHCNTLLSVGLNNTFSLSFSLLFRTLLS